MNTNFVCKDHPEQPLPTAQAFSRHFNMFHETMIGTWPVSDTMAHVIHPDGTDGGFVPLEPTSAPTYNPSIILLPASLLTDADIPF